MFKSYEFTYAGMPASMFSMYVADMSSNKHTANSFGNKANLVEKRLANRIAPIHYGVRYNDSPLSFTLIFGADHKLDRYEMQAVSKWLTGYQDYQWLSIDQPDMEHIQFRCLIQELTPIHLSWAPMAFEAKIICDCPYGYSYPFEKTYQISGTTTVRFYNDSSCMEQLRPEMLVNLSAGNTSFGVKNLTTGDEMMFTGLPGSVLTIRIDNENQVITEEVSGYDLYDYFNFGFLGLDPGDNELVFTGSGSVTLKGRYLYNVGA